MKWVKKLVKNSPFLIFAIKIVKIDLIFPDASLQLKCLLRGNEQRKA